MKIRPIAILFVLFLLLSGCYFGSKNVKRVQPEILLATECGFDKLACCASEPTCNFGQQCCPDPNSPNRNYCSEDCSCGGEDEFCCEKSQCSNGLTCRDGLCLKCGGEGDVCCPGTAVCSSSLACLDDKCVKCGEIGNPCCQGSKTCETAKGENNECYEGLCRSCGFDGSPACSSTSPCLKNQLLTGNRCERCGEINKPCCNKDLVGYDCDQSKGLVCELGFCSVIK
jgi:hypothetical protein